MQTLTLHSTWFGPSDADQHLLKSQGLCLGSTPKDSQDNEVHAYMKEQDLLHIEGIVT